MRYSILSIFGVTLYAALVIASSTGRFFFFELLRLLVFLYLLTYTVGCVLEKGERRAFCIGFSVFAWAFWCLEYTHEVWSYSPIGVLVMHADLPLSPSIWPSFILTAIVFFAFVGGKTAVAVHRKNLQEKIV